MISPSLVKGVCSVTLGVPDPEAAARFYADVWNLRRVQDDGGIYFAGSGRQPWLLSLTRADESVVRFGDLEARSQDACEEAARRLARMGWPHFWRDLSDVPGGGHALCFTDPRGRNIRLRTGFRDAEAVEASDMPIKITHLVLNSDNAGQDAKDYAFLLDIRTIDETVAMFFMNADSDHHAIAFAKTDNVALNHIAFEMPSIDAVMRGAGRMRDAGFPIGWGVGRHGPGANVFSYFVGPSGEVIEYTAEIEQVDAGYAVGAPADWAWPAGRNDRWGVGLGPTDELKQAQRRVFFTRAGI